MFKKVMEGFNQASTPVVTQVTVDNLFFILFICLKHLGQGLGKRL